MQPRTPDPVRADGRAVQGLLEHLQTALTDIGYLDPALIAEIKRVLKPRRHCLLHLSVAPEGKPHPDNDLWAANTLRSSQAVIDLFGPGYTVVEDRLLGQPNWPTYWTLLVHKKPS